MIKIAICDDEELIIEKVASMIYSLEDRFEEEIVIDTYDESSMLYQRLESGEKYDLILLDISMPEKTGVDIATLIRNRLDDNMTQIVFISSDRSYAMELFKVQPMEFLIKPVDVAQIERVMTLAYKLLCDGRQMFRYESAGEVHRIPISKILYFEGSLRKIAMHTTDGCVEFYGNLKNVYEKLNRYNFCYTHKSFIVNANRISTFNTTSVKLENGSVIPVSRSKKDEVMQLCNTMI